MPSGRAILSWLILIVMVGVVDPAKASILPHRATYTLSLESAQPFSGIAHEGTTITKAEGFMAVEWRKTCGGLSSYQRFSLNIDESNGYRTLIETRFSSWENHDGSTYEFDSAQWRNKQIVSQQKGEVTRRSDKSMVLYETGPKKQLALPAQTIFPATHMRAILKAAEAGKKIITNTVFDGADQDGLNDISAFISRERPLKKDILKIALEKTTLAQEAWNPKNYWPVHMSFYKHGDEETIPFFQVKFDLIPGGIPAGFVMDYDDFSIRGVPKTIDVLPDPPCKDGQTPP